VPELGATLRRRTGRNMLRPYEDLLKRARHFRVSPVKALPELQRAEEVQDILLLGG